MKKIYESKEHRQKVEHRDETCTEQIVTTLSLPSSTWYRQGMKSRCRKLSVLARFGRTVSAGSPQKITRNTIRVCPGHKVTFRAGNL